MLILSEKDLRSLLTMRDCIRAVERGFLALAAGETLAPERLVMNLAGGVFLEMPSAMRSDENALGTKIVSVFEKNRERHLATVQAVYLLLDGETGEPLALMEGRFITAIRTAAVSALATKHMMAEGASRLGIIGAGVQGRFHLEAMAEVARFSEVLIASRSEEKAQGLAEKAQEIFDEHCDVATVEEVARCSNVICACTSSPAPLFAGRLLSPGTHINAVGAFTPETREIDTETVAASRVIIDDHTAAGREAGELLIPISEGAIAYDHIKGTLADLVSGRVRGRELEDEITLFKSCGLAIEDLVTARLAYERAVERGAGARIDL
ncbi:MAG: ornithine cyclodeaminase family protein [Acidobacteriota bacterium]